MITTANAAIPNVRKQVAARKNQVRLRVKPSAAAPKNVQQRIAKNAALQENVK